MKYIFALLFALHAAALASTSPLTINNTTGKVNVPAGLIPNFTALTVGNNWMPMLPTPQGYGAIADGRSHPLSNKYASLGDAQLIYPFVTSLTQELDYCGLQSCANQGSFYIPPGMYILGNSTLQTVNEPQIGGQSVAGDGITIFGAGPEITMINANGGADAVRIMGRYQTLRDLTIVGVADPSKQILSSANGVTLGDGNYSNHFHLVHVTIRNFNIGFSNPNGWDGSSIENSYLLNNFCGAFTDSNQDILRFASTSIGNDAYTFSATGGVTNSGNRTVKVSSTTGVFVGATISGAGIPAFTKVAGLVDDKTLILSADATDTAGGVNLQVATIGLSVRGTGSVDWNGGVSGANGVSIAATNFRATNVHFEGADQTYITGAENNGAMLDNCQFQDGNNAFRHLEIEDGQALITRSGCANSLIDGANGRVYVYVKGWGDVQSPDRTAVEDYNGVVKVTCGDYFIQTGDNALPPPSEYYRGKRYFQAYAAPYWNLPDAIYTCLNMGGSYAWVKDGLGIGLQQFVPQVRPPAPHEGAIYSDLMDHHLYFFNGTDWKQLDK